MFPKPLLKDYTLWLWVEFQQVALCDAVINHHALQWISYNLRSGVFSLVRRLFLQQEEEFLAFSYFLNLLFFWLMLSEFFLKRRFFKRVSLQTVDFRRNQWMKRIMRPNPILQLLMQKTIIEIVFKLHIPNINIVNKYLQSLSSLFQIQVSKENKCEV